MNIDIDIKIKLKKNGAEFLKSNKTVA